MNDLIHCLTQLERLKTVERGCTVGKRKESTAEHSWNSILIADIVLEFIDEPLNRARVLELLLYHDLVEVYAGDAKFNDPKQMKVKKEKEHKAMEKIQSFLPNKTRYKSLMEEYENRSSREAYFAKAIDCLEGLINALNEKRKPKLDGFPEKLLREKYEPYVRKFDFTNNLFEEIMKRLKEQDKI